MTNLVAFLRAAQMAKMLGVSKATFWRWSARPGFPQPSRPTTGSTLFPVREVLAWVKSQQEAE